MMEFNSTDKNLIKQTDYPSNFLENQDDILRNYIGLTGITTIHQVEYTLNAFENFCLNQKSNPMAMIGFLISPRNLNIDWKSSRYPKFELFKPMLEKCRGKTFSTLHIDAKSTSNWLKSLIELLYNIDNNLGNLMDLVKGIQVNVKHPNPLEIYELKDAFPGIKIILQYSSDFLDINLNLAIKDLKSYEKCIDYLLIDPSRGQGLQIDITKTSEHYKKIRKKFPKINIGFAGGFTPFNIETIILRLFDFIKTINFSIDCETGLRTESDNLDLLRVYQYIKNSKEILEWLKKSGHLYE